jgi:hypothetical protein
MTSTDRVADPTVPPHARSERRSRGPVNRAPGVNAARAWPVSGQLWSATGTSLAPIVAELLVVTMWTAAVTRPYLNLDPSLVPSGREYLSVIPAHHFWTRLKECGACAMWDGTVQGGSPALADLFGSTLHPLVVISTLGWGVTNGARLALAGAFLMAGLAQWWLGWVLGLGRLARVWSACMAIVGGHLAGRMEVGAFGWVVSTAACALVLPPLLLLARGPSRRASVLLGLVLAMAAVAGQGYMQIGLALVFPAALLLLRWDASYLRLFARRFALALSLAILLAAHFLVPFFHFFPQAAKDTDPQLRSGQAFVFVPLNLVINDYAYYTSDALGKLPYPSLYVNFIGWVPVLLAAYALSSQREQQRRVVLFLTAWTVLSLFTSSADFLPRLVRASPVAELSQLLAGIRYFSVLAGLAVPAILALAGIGVDRLWRATWPRFQAVIAHSAATRQFLGLDTRWLLLLPLTLALVDARAFGSQWIRMAPVGSELSAVIASLRTPDLQWVNLPFGEHFWIEAAANSRMKLGIGIKRWRWKDRPPPEAILEASGESAPAGMTYLSTVGGLNLYTAAPGREYAAVTDAGGGRAVCSARGTGGDIDMTCDTPRDGVLIVKENSWAGWHAYVNGQPFQLRRDRWLAIDLPAGNQLVQFRYRPWDVPLGIFLSLVGVGLALYYWRKKPNPASTAPIRARD